MTKYLFWAASVALIVVVACGFIVVNLITENERLRRNEYALMQGVEYYRTQNNRSAASVAALEVEVAEFRALNREAAKEIASLGIRLRRAESVARSVAVTTLADTVVLCDTIIVRDTVAVSARHFAAADVWSRVEGILFGDSLRYAVRTTDTLHQVVHRVPRKFMFIPYGTKAIRQEVWLSNPNTELVYTEYIELSRRKRER
jgi:hypothetical protein